MDIEQMQQTWSELNQKLDKQKLLNEKLIIKITSEQSKNRLNRITYLEIFSIAGMVILSIYIVPRFNRLDTSISQIGGIVTVAIAVIAIIFSIIMLVKISRIDIQKNSFVQSLKAITELKSFSLKYALAGWITAPMLIFSSIAVLAKLIHQKDILAHVQFYLILPAVALVIAAPLSYFLYKRLYKKSIQEVESLLHEFKDKP